LDLPYTYAIDMWSLGCILVELCIGLPLFESENEKELMSMMFEIFGLPPKHMIDKSPKKFSFFDDSTTAKIYVNSKGKTRVINGTSLNSIIG
jgi:serine/threonine protein kinase